MHQSIILLTYKRRVLLKRKDFILDRREQNFWHFIVGVKDKNESFEEAIQKEVEKETGIKLEAIELISHNKKEYFYHACLTDSNVNDIVRPEGEVIEFFSLKELDSLSLSILTKLLISKHGDLFEKVDEIPDSRIMNYESRMRN